MAATQRAVDARMAVSADPPPACARCGATDFLIRDDGGSYCGSCLTRRPGGRDRSEADLGVIAGASDLGMRHEHNEDGYALAVVGPVYAAAVCDGVSSSSRSDTASHTAAAAAVRALVRELTARTATPTGQDALVATSAAITAAREAAIAAAGVAEAEAGSSTSPPSTTFVSAVVTPDAVTVGWIGDSRAYWFGDDGTTVGLTVDDTLAGQLAAAGVAIGEDTPHAGALLQWLGADANTPEPHVFGFRPNGSGQVIVCSDGLYRYAPEAAEMRAVLEPLSGLTPILTVRALVRFAITSGGVDNVTVVAMPYPPAVTG